MPFFYLGRIQSLWVLQQGDQRVWYPSEFCLRKQPHGDTSQAGQLHRTLAHRLPKSLWTKPAARQSASDCQVRNEFPLLIGQPLGVNSNCLHASFHHCIKCWLQFISRASRKRMIGQTKFSRLLISYIRVQARDFRIWINQQSNLGQTRNRLPFRNCKRFPMRSAAKCVRPVAFPPGRAKLLKFEPTGSGTK